MNRLALLAVLVVVPSSAVAGGAGTAIEAWTRKAGSHVGYSRGRENLKVIDLGKLKQEERTLEDVQARAKRKYRGVGFAALLAAAPAPADHDLVLLHFMNGMVVPLPLRDEAALAKLDLFVATAVEQVDGAGKAYFTTDLPPVRKQGAEDRDHRPIFFDGNKVVVRTRWHPLTALDGPDVFSPWPHVDRLEGLEYAKADAYWKQFTFGDTPELQKGLAVFQSRCGFCHGLMKVGASWGWDYLDPLPISSFKKPQALAQHGRHREVDAPEKGLMMPGIKEFSDADAKALWKWIDAASKTKPGDYRP
jgi:hypothetical protein